MGADLGSKANHKGSLEGLVERFNLSQCKGLLSSLVKTAIGYLADMFPANW